MRDRVERGPGAAASPEETLRERLWAEARQDGGNPGELLLLLARVVRERIWEGLRDRAGQPLTFRALVAEPHPVGIGLPERDVLALVALHHRHEAGDPALRDELEQMRREVRRLLLEPLAPHGGARRAGVRRDADRGMGDRAGGGTGRDYLLRRLRRDRPDLAEAVLEGRASAHAAAVEAGIRRRQVAMPRDAGRAADALARAFGEEDRLRIARALLEPLGYDATRRGAG